MAKILVVDDQAGNRALMVALINMRGHQALEAVDGAAALSIVYSEHPDLVISDILMPTMDGYEFVRRIRADPAIADTEVIFCSAHYLEQESRQLAKDCGVSTVLMKPCDPDDILLAIDQALAHAPKKPDAPEPVPDTQEFDREHLRLLTNKLSEKVTDLEAANRRLGSLLTELRTSEAGLHHAQLLAKLTHVITGADGVIQSWPASMPQMIGIEPEHMIKNTQEWLARVHSDDHALFLAKLEEANTRGKPTDFEYRLQHQGGAWLQIRQVMEPINLTDAHHGNSLFHTLQDITDSKVAERKVIRLNRVLAVLSGINALIVRVHNRKELFEESCRIAIELGQFKMAWIGLVDRETMKIVPVTSTGTDPEFLEIIKESLSLNDDALLATILPVRAVREGRAVISNDLRTEEKTIYCEDRMARGIFSVAFLPVMVSQEPVALLALYSGETGFFDDEEMQYLTELAGDIGFALDHINKEERLNYLAYYDVLTGLPNRSMFMEQVNLRLRLRSGDNMGMALALMDIDRFQIINETLGRKAGDELLKLLVQRLQQSEIGFDTVACVGINCFGMVLLDPRDAQSVAHTLERLLRDCFDQPFLLDESELRMTGKIGIALYPVDGGDAEVLHRHAETALKRARGSIEPVLFYAPEMNTRVAAALNLESRLRTAVELGQFVLYYQPKVNLATGKLTSVEALIRWNDPQTGLMSPAQFIPILEETGLIYEVGRWALRQALDDNQRWRAAGLAHIRIAVNVSPLQMRHRNFIAEVKQAIGDDPQVADGLELELTESLIMEDVNHSIDRLREIRAMGVTIAIDDFGTGFSSLSYLTKLPVDTLKIDRSFIIAMAVDSQGLALVSTIINLAHALKLKVVAEGVDAEEQASLLRLLSCDEMQGYLFSQPLSREQLETTHLSPSLKPA